MSLRVDAINDILWKELSISYCEIEPGCGVFYVHDEADYFPEECVVDSSGKPFDEVYCELYSTFEEAIDTWCDRTGESRKGRLKSKMLEFIDNYEYGDTYFYIHPLIRE